MARTDVGAANPFEACARREVHEELGLTVGDLDWVGVIVARQKLQPIVLLTGHLGDTWDNLWPVIQHARDWNQENRALYALPPDRLTTALRRKPFTDAAAYHLWCYAQSATTRAVLIVDWERYRLGAKD